MNWDALSPQEIHAAQVITGATMAGFLLAGFCGRHARRIRLAVAALYFGTVALYAGYVVLH